MHLEVSMTLLSLLREIRWWLSSPELPNHTHIPTNAHRKTHSGNNCPCRGLADVRKSINIHIRPPLSVCVCVFIPSGPVSSCVVSGFTSCLFYCCSCCHALEFCEHKAFSQAGIWTHLAFRKAAEHAGTSTHYRDHEGWIQPSGIFLLQDFFNQNEPQENIRKVTTVGFFLDTHEFIFRFR